MIRKFLLIVLATVGAVYMAICGLLYLSQRSYIYFPVPRRGDVPAFVMQSGDADLVVSTYQAGQRRAVLYFGGNAEDVSQTVASLARDFPGRDVYAMHYRGYGGSTGMPSERALVADGSRLFDLVAKDHDGIVVVGRSLGSGVAVQVAAGRRIERLVLVTPYNSIAELAAEQFPLFPTGLLLRDKYESWRHVPRIRAPSTIIVAGRDQVIPNASSLRFAGAFRSGSLRLVTIPEAGHDDVSGYPVYREALGGKQE